MKIVLLEPIGINKNLLEEYRKIFKKDGHDFVYYSDRVEKEEKLIKRSEEADIIILTNIPLTKNVIDNCPNLKLISVAFTGVDHIDLKRCKEKNITVCNSSGYANQAVAELTVGMIINLLRNVIKCDKATRTFRTRKGLIGNELYGKKLGIIGTGSIGMKVAELGSAFGCNLLGYDKVEKKNGKKLGIEYTDLEILLKESDIVTLHVPLLPETKNLINKNNIKLMKSSSILINAARGPVVDSNALAEALNEGIIAGAGIDVFEMEPPIPEDHPILNSPNVIVTPHVAFATEEAFNKRAEIVFNNIIKWLENDPQNVISD